MSFSKILSFISAVIIQLAFFCSIACTQAEAAETLPKYRVIDLGTLETDRSRAVAINERGQVLGLIEDRGRKSAFLWDEKEGLKIIDLPGYSGNNLFLNNNGQIAGYRDDAFGGRQAFIWDPTKGFIDVWCLGKDGASVTGFNDKGQVIGFVMVEEDDQQHAILWDHGKMIDLTKELNQQISLSWQCVNPVAINNLGHIAVTATRRIQNKNGSITWVTKSYIWKDALFAAIVPEKSPETNVEVRFMDDYENIIVYIQDDFGSEEYSDWFISKSDNFKAYLLSGADMIRNKQPTYRDRLPGKLKKDYDGQAYYSYGIDLWKLLKADYPFYSREKNIRDQNSKGWIVGSMETIYSTQHAFLAIPEK